VTYCRNCGVAHAEAARYCRRCGERLDRAGDESGDRPPARERPPEGDPVKTAYEDEYDLYGVATWDVRSRLDHVAVSVVRTLDQSKTAAPVALAGALFVLQATVAVGIVFTEPLLGVLAVASILPAVALAGYLWYDDPTTREPFVPLAVTFLLAMVFAMLAAVVNSSLGPLFEVIGALGLVFFFFLVVGPIEEFVKWLAIRVYAARTDAFRTVVDGAVYGAAAGLGFAAIENLVYIVSVYLEADGGAGQLESAVSVTAQRLFVGPGHVIFSAWAGFYLGLASFNPDQYWPIVVKGLLVAAFIHGLYNTMVSVVPQFVSLGVGGILLLIVGYHGFWLALLSRKIRAYRSLYRRLDPHEREGQTR